MCDDVFQDSDDERPVLEKTWVKTVQALSKNGYREGLDAGQEESLQEGFNEAFQVSTRLLFRVAELRGHVSGKLSYKLMRSGALSSHQEQELQLLLADILEYETELLTFNQERFQEELRTTSKDNRLANQKECAKHVDEETESIGQNVCDKTNRRLAHKKSSSGENLDEETEETTLNVCDKINSSKEIKTCGINSNSESVPQSTVTHETNADVDSVDTTKQIHFKGATDSMCEDSVDKFYARLKSILLTRSVPTT